ncbi:hypothetical protein [Streptomyces sp. NPDC002640]
MAGIQQAERIERLKALLVGESTSRRAGAALASAPSGSKNLLLAVMLHGANRLREGRELTDLEQVLVDALKTVIDTEEIKAWGQAYRQTVTTAFPWKLIVPLTITSRPSAWGYSMADLRWRLPKLAQEAWEAPNVSLLSLEDLATGRIEEDEAFVEAMRETGFAVTGVARYPGSTSAALSSQESPAGQGRTAALQPWRVKLEMDSFYVERAVGDQGGGRDEIYFAASSGVGGGVGDTFVSEEFGAVKEGQTRTFSSNRKVFLDQMCSSGTVLTSVQVWEADQSNSEWYDKLQLALETTVEKVDEYVESNPMNNLVPVPDTVAIGWEIAKIFIALMDTLRNHDDLSCSRTFILTRQDMAVLAQRPELEWNFNGDGHHKLRVRYTGQRPAYPTGSLYCVSRTQGSNREDAGEWSLPLPLEWTSRTAPRLAVHDNKLHVIFADGHMKSSYYDGTAWSAPSATSVPTDQPPAPVPYRRALHCYATDPSWGNLRWNWWSDGWSNWYVMEEMDTAAGPAAVNHDNRRWIARSAFKSGNELILSDEDPDVINGFNHHRTLATSSSAFGTPSIAYGLDRMWISVLQDRNQMHTYWSAKGQDPAKASWNSAQGPHGTSNNSPVLHYDGHTLWCAHTDTNGKPYLSRRVNETSTSPGTWSTPVPIADGTTVLDTPGIAVYQGRLYAFYHA